MELHHGRQRLADYNLTTGMTFWSTAARLAWLLVVGVRAAGAQTLPSEPIALAGDRVTISGDVSASFGSDDPGFFNYTDYQHSALRLLRLDLSAAVRMSPHFALLGEVRTENLGRVRPYAFYLRIRPWTARDFDIQVGRRLGLRPASGLSGLVVGTSLARGPFLSQAAARAAVGDGDREAFTQTVWGGDLEYSRGHYLLRLETIVSAWHLPIVQAPALAQPLRAVYTSVEGRYRLMTGLYAAARFDQLGFNDVVGTRLTAPWDAPVSRVEAGAGYSLQRNLLLKVSYQHDSRDGGVLLEAAHMIAAQLVYWF